MIKIIVLLTIFPANFSYATTAYGEGICATFADGHSECISDVDKNGEMALNLKKKASDSFKSADSKSTTSDKSDYNNRAKESAIDMLIKATQKYKEGSLSKDKYVEVAIQVSQMAEYANKTNESNPVTSPTEPKKTPLVDKVVIVSAAFPHGSPDISDVSDEQLKKMENKNIPALREKFKELQTMQKNIGVNQLNLKCEIDADCVSLPVGNKICGGPVSYLLVSKQDPNFSSINDKLSKYTTLDEEFEKMIHGFGGLCDYVMPPKVACQKNVCTKI
jgi:hypothetical protein